MHPKKTRFLLGIFAFIVLAGFLHIYRIVNMVLDFRAIAKMSFEGPSGISGMPSRRPILPLVTGLALAGPQADRMGDLVSSLYSTGTTRKAEPIAKVLEGLKDVPDELTRKMIEEIPERVERAFAAIPPIPEPPEYLNLAAPTPNFREARATARFWYAFGRKAAEEGRHDLALQTMAGIILFSQMFEADSPDGLSLITKMIGIAIRKIGAVGLLEIATVLQLPGETAKLWTKRLLDLETRIPSMALAMKCERLMLPSILNPKFLRDLESRNDGSRVPRTLFNALRNKALLEQYLSPIFDPQIQACDQPYSEAMKAVEAHRRVIEELSTNMTRPGPHWVGYFFQPERFFLETLLAISVPNTGKALQQDFLCRQVVRGAAISLALNGYRLVWGHIPETLAELGKWLGQPIPDDLFSGKPLHYHPEKKNILFSVGLDEIPESPDDLIFYPVPE